MEGQSVVCGICNSDSCSEAAQHAILKLKICNCFLHIVLLLQRSSDKACEAVWCVFMYNWILKLSCHFDVHCLFVAHARGHVPPCGIPTQFIVCAREHLPPCCVMLSMTLCVHCLCTKPRPAMPGVATLDTLCSLPVQGGRQHSTGCPWPHSSGSCCWQGQVG